MTTKPAALTASLLDYLSFLEAKGEPPYRLEQITRALFVQGIGAWSEATTLSAPLRSALEEAFPLIRPQIIQIQKSGDGSEKFLWRLSDGERIESVVLPKGESRTLCLSTQVGCRMGCVFCATGQMGLRRNLFAGEIVEQFRFLNEKEKIDRLVFMGMGEPLDNLDHVLEALQILTGKKYLNLSRNRITVSTSGIVPAMDRLAEEGPGVRLAVSLAAPDDERRSALMPINKRYPIKEVIAAAVRYAEQANTRVTAEYVLIDGQNDSDEDAVKLARLLGGTPIGLNVIYYNAVKDDPFGPSRRTDAFLARLVGKVARLTVRRSLGGDIAAACGQLATEYEETSS